MKHVEFLKIHFQVFNFSRIVDLLLFCFDLEYPDAPRQMLVFRISRLKKNRFLCIIVCRELLLLLYIGHCRCVTIYVCLVTRAKCSRENVANNSNPCPPIISAVVIEFICPFPVLGHVY